MLSALEQLAEAAARTGPIAAPAETSEPDSSSTTTLLVARPRWWARLWSWLRYGRWRWA
jgi:hypothetical protein